MLVEIQGLQQDTIEVKLEILPRVGEMLTVTYGADAEVHGQISPIRHSINQHADEHKISITLQAIN